MTIDSEVRLEQAKKRMEWNEERYGEPTILEYLRYYKSGVIGEIHIEAAVAQEANKARLDELRIMWDWPKDKGLAYFEQRIQKREAELIRLTADKEQA